MKSTAANCSPETAAWLRVNAQYFTRTELSTKLGLRQSTIRALLRKLELEARPDEHPPLPDRVLRYCRESGPVGGITTKSWRLGELYFLHYPGASYPRITIHVAADELETQT